MPIYEYECTKCGSITEALQKFSDAPLTKCDKCKGKVRKLISQSTFHLKGSGWYVTDYAGKGNAPKTKSDETEKASTPKETKSSGDASEKKTSSTKAKKDKD